VLSYISVIAPYIKGISRLNIVKTAYYS
jgi:hypothetical protein